MSNELNVNEIAYGVLDPGVTVEIYYNNSNYDKHKKRASFFSVSPDPVIPIGGGWGFEIAPNQVDLEITRSWMTVWTGEDLSHVFQWNNAITNIGSSAAAYHLLQAETDN